MLIPPKFLAKWFRVRPQGVLHVGAHLAEEFDLYREEGFGKTLWVEAQQELIPKIKEAIAGSDDVVYQAAVWSETGKTMTLQITNNGQSTSLYRLAEHLDAYPAILPVEDRKVPTIRLDDLIPDEETFDFVNLDIQGAELEALRSMGTRIASVRWIYSEVNQRMLYENIPFVDELDEFLSAYNFRRVATVWTGAGWGDALYSQDYQSIIPTIRNSIGAMVLKITGLGSPRKIIIRLRRKVFRTIDRLRRMP